MHRSLSLSSRFSGGTFTPSGVSSHFAGRWDRPRAVFWVRYNAPRLIGHLGRAAAVAYLLVLTFPGGFYPLNVGLDFSWMDALNLLAHSEFVYGRDVNFTYGPLGFLLWPMPVGDNLIFAAIERVLVYIAFALSVIYHSWHQPRVSAVWAFVIVYVFALVTALQYEYQLAITVGLLLCVPPSSRLAFRTSFVAAAILCGTLLFTKLGLGLICLSMLGSAWIAVSFACGRQLLSFLAICAGVTLTVFVAWSFFFFHSPDNLFHWLNVSRSIVNGYDAGMSSARADQVEQLGLTILVIGLIGLIAAVATRSAASQAGLVFLAPLILSYKHAAVGQPAFFFPVAIAIAGVMILLMHRTRYVHLAMTASLAAILLTLPVAVMQNWLGNSSNIVFGTWGEQNLQRLLNFPQTVRELRSASDSDLAKHRLPPEWLQTLDDGNATVDVVPWELSYVVANQLHWQPSPILQTYVGYTADLDQLNADFYRGNSAPRFVIAEFIEMLSTPATWRSIFDNYEVAAVMPDATTKAMGAVSTPVLLRRRAQPLIEQTQVVNTTYTTLDDVVTIPDDNDNLVVQMKFELTKMGALQRLLLGVQPIFLKIELASGRRGTFRVSADSLANGIPVDTLVTNIQDIVEISEGTKLDRLRSFQFAGPGLSSYRNSVRLTWLRSSTVQNQ